MRMKETPEAVPHGAHAPCPCEEASEEAAVTLEAPLQLALGGRVLGGERQMRLLEAVEACGSITHAARMAGVSYKTAWDAIDAMNQLAGEPLVVRATGGRGGGGTVLTLRGRRLLAGYRRIEAEHRRFLAHLAEDAGHLADDYRLLRRMMMRTSARNQFMGTVSRIERGAVNDEVMLAIAGGHELVAVVTRESTDALGLAPGCEAIALVKSSSVILVTESEGVRFSARNALGGRIMRLHPGAVNTEVVLDIGAGLTLAAIITNTSADALGLEEGMQARAVFKASSVIVAVPA